MNTWTPIVWFGLALSGLYATSCQLEGNLGNLAKEIGNPDKETFESPGDLLLEGEYRSIAFDGTSRTGPFVTALRSDNSLVILPFDSVKECSIGPIRSFRTARIRSEDKDDAQPEDARLSVILRGTDDSPERLVFTDLLCNVSDVEVETSIQPLSDSFAKDGSYLVQDAVGDLWTVDPWTNKKKLVASNTTVISRDNTAMLAEGLEGKRWMYTLEDGDVVARTDTFEEVLRTGGDVNAVLHHEGSDGSVMLLVRRSTNRWFAMPVDAPEDETLIAENACSVRVFDGASGREVLFSDCSSKDLMLYQFGTEDTKMVGSAVRSYRVMGQATDGPIVLYVAQEGSESSDVGPLYARWGFESPSFLGEQGHLKLSWINSSGTQRPVVDWKDGSGTLKYGRVGEDLDTLAKKVVYVSSVGVISDYDGKNGKLSRISGSELSFVADAVHADGLRVDSDKERLLMITHFDGERGDLNLVRDDDVQVLAKDVQPDAYQYASRLPMVSVLNDYDKESGTATLRMVRTDRPGEIEISQGVRESLEVGWPEQGLLYSAPQGDPPGIYFSKAK